MNKKEPSHRAQDIDRFNWYYESKKSINLVHEVRDPTTGQVIRTDMIEIPWEKLEVSRKRCL